MACAAPAITAMPPEGYKDLKNMKDDMKVQLALSPDYQDFRWRFHMAREIKVSCRQAGWCGEWNDKQLTQHSTAAFHLEFRFTHLSIADPPFREVRLASV